MGTGWAALVVGGESAGDGERGGGESAGDGERGGGESAGGGESVGGGERGGVAGAEGCAAGLADHLGGQLVAAVVPQEQGRAGLARPGTGRPSASG